MRGPENKIFAHVDWTFLALYFILVILGISTIYSAVYDPDHPSLFDLDTEHGKQIMWLGISLFLGTIIFF